MRRGLSNERFERPRTALAYSASASRAAQAHLVRRRMGCVGERTVVEPLGPDTGRRAPRCERVYWTAPDGSVTLVSESSRVLLTEV